MRVYVANGHSPRHPGARGASGRHEYPTLEPVRDAAVRVLRDLGIDATPWGRGTSLRTMIQRINADLPDLMVEIHWDSLTPDHPLARSAYCLHWPGSPLGEHAARHIAAACADVLGIDDGGARASERLDLIRLTRCPAVIVECHNGLAADIHADALDRLEELGEAIGHAIATALAPEVPDAA